MVLLVAGLEFPVVLALLDCAGRDPVDFPDGAAGRRSWLRGLVLAVLTAPVLVGYGIVLGYYWSVVKADRPKRV